MKPPKTLTVKRDNHVLKLYVQKAQRIPKLIKLPFHMNKTAYEVVAKLFYNDKILFEVHYIITIRRSYLYEPDLKIIPKNPVLFVKELIKSHVKDEYDSEFFFEHYSYYIRCFTYYNGLDATIKDIGYVKVTKKKNNEKGEYEYDFYNWGKYMGTIKFTIERDEYIKINVFYNNKRIDTIILSDFNTIEFFIARNPKIKVAIEAYKDTGEVTQEAFIEYLTTKYARIL